MIRFRIGHYLKTSLWFVPLLFVLAGIALSFVTTSVDDGTLIPQSVTGDPNATTDSCQPLVLGPQFGSFGATAADLSVAFVSQAAVDADVDHMTTRRRRVAVRGTRGIGPADLVHNTRLGLVDVDPRTGTVTFDGDVVDSEPADSVSLSRLYFL